jgi:ribonuclease J
LVDDHLALAEDIEVMLDGVPLGLEEELAIAAEKGFESMPKNRRKEDELVEEVVKNAIRRAADMAWGKKPVVKVVVARV